MRRGCRTEHLLKVCLTGILLISAGCRRAPVRTISTGEWLYEIGKRAGIPQNDAPPYFIDINESSLYYHAVQDAAGWGIIDTRHPMDPEQPLTKEFAAYSLVNLAGLQQTSSDLQIRDISDSPFREQIEQSVGFGLFRTDSRFCFHPNELMSREEALEKLEQVITYIDSRIPDSSVSDPFPDIVSDEPESGDPAGGSILYPSSAHVEPGMYLQEKEGSQWYEVIGTENRENGTEAVTVPVEPDDVFGSMHITGSYYADFEDAEILDAFSGDEEKSSFTENDRAYLTALYLHPHLSRSYTFNGYEISWGLSSSGIHALVSGTLRNGLRFHSSFRLSNVRPVYDWQFEHGSVKNGYFRVDCLLTEEAGITGAASRRLSGDLSQLDPYDLLNSVRKVFREDTDTVDLVIPLCTLRVPLPEQPVLSLIVRLELRIFANGRAEFTCTQQISAGMEIRNGSTRMIHDIDHTHKETLTAAAETTADLFFGLSAGRFTLADIGLCGGMRAEVTPTLHMYRGKKHTAVQEDELPYDLLDDNASPSFLVCADLNAGWTLSMDINSSSSLAGKLGLSCSEEILTPEKNSILPAGMRHMENGMFVKTCTRGDYDTPKKSEVPSADRIRITTYSLIMNPQESAEIPVSGLPDGYTMKDLTAESSDPAVADVHGLTVHALQPGSTRITIRTADGRYSVSCNVLVRSVPV